MSDVVATILLLALTVTLFASIFAFVTAFPSPPPQNNNQFQASLLVTSNLTYVTGLHILHLAGPSVAGNAQIFLKSAGHPAAPEFQNPYSVSSGLGGASTWNLGQVWNLTFPATQRPQLPDNITVYVVASNQLVFSVILPGTSIPPPPTVASTAIIPATPTIGTIYTVYATITGAYTSNSVYVNLAAVPGGPSTPQKMSQNAQGLWTYTVPSGATANGTFYGFVNASNGAGQQSTGLVLVTIYPSSGSTGSWTLTVGPASGLVGSIATARGAGFSGSSSVVLTMDTVPITPSGSSNATCTFAGSTITTTAAGAFTCQFAIPAAAGSGPGTLLASDTTFPTQTASALYTVTAWTLTLSPTTHAASSAVTVTMTGAGFAATSTVLLYYNGAVITPAGCTTGSLGGTNVVTTTGAGAFVCTWSLSGGTAGTYPFTAIDTTSGQVVTAYFVRT